MLSKVIVMPQDSFNSWLNSRVMKDSLKTVKSVSEENAAPESDTTKKM